MRRGLNPVPRGVTRAHDRHLVEVGMCVSGCIKCAMQCEEGGRETEKEAQYTWSSSLAC